MSAAQLRILLVEDNPDDELLTVMALEESRIANSVDVARDGVEALELLFDESRLLPQLVLLDLKLPRLGGLEVLKQMREHPRTCLLPVVILTTSREDRDLLDGYGNGANSYIRKPVDFDQFTHAVRQLGMYWLLLNEAPPPPGPTDEQHA